MSTPRSQPRSSSVRDAFWSSSARSCSGCCYALDRAIVATALPTIAGDLHGLSELSWVAPTIACAPIIKPPPPLPCTARKAISCPIVWRIPDSTEPTRKITIAAWKKRFAPVEVVRSTWSR